MNALCLNNLMQGGMPLFTSNYQEVLVSEDEGLSIKFNQKVHLVDSIVGVKKTSCKNSLFQISMYCDCCKDRLYWFNLKEISQNGSKQLELLASQFEEFHMNGVEFSSQNTYYAEEDFDEDFLNGTFDDTMNDDRGKNMNDGYFDFSDEDETFERRKKSQRLGQKCFAKSNELIEPMYLRHHSLSYTARNSQFLQQFTLGQQNLNQSRQDLQHQLQYNHRTMGFNDENQQILFNRDRLNPNTQPLTVSKKRKFPEISTNVHQNADFKQNSNVGSLYRRQECKKRRMNDQEKTQNQHSFHINNQQQIEFNQYNAINLQQNSYQGQIQRQEIRTEDQQIHSTIQYFLWIQSKSSIINQQFSLFLQSHIWAA
ncbi:UNKNOWN [Stylonychia lemnae]|uniref:Uncharacterized protein n=1 Tax=Stylonychia lemnae TaxID=5949 RepID=A0A078B2H6_STYLE|nr:UNKNOWN [Stylonychia lemnae]|eukprot:CDW87422.1 UNKNOWN [Stylonychia lemnae]